MSKRIYIANLSATDAANRAAENLAKSLAAACDAAVVSAFPDPKVALTVINGQAEPVKDLLSRCTENSIVLGNVPALPEGVSPLLAHLQIASHLSANTILVDGGAQPGPLAHVAAHQLWAAHATPVATVVLRDNPDDKTGAPTGSKHSPVIFSDGEFSDADVQVILGVLRDVDTVTPLAYQASLVSRAAANRKRIVLPESEDPRILQAAAILRDLDAVDLTLLGEPESVHAAAAELKLDLSGIDVVSTKDPQRLEKYATKLAELRQAKGMTIEEARETITDISYFGTMMIYLGEADGMVSGAAHTTAHTIRPALQFIKTQPGVKTVSGAFLMLFADHVDLYADCAVTIEPDAEQLADIAATSAKTAQQFGVPARVAMISYSTGDSGTGETVDKVKAALQLVSDRHPELTVDGPMQFDAAVDRAVAEKKMPDSTVAGQARVFIFESLDVGNCTYKAVQRTAGAVAVGPILQGLNRPVNDLSRGALVEDIVNTVIITAIQAQ